VFTSKRNRFDNLDMGMADTTINRPRSVDLEPELRAALADTDADQLAHERFIAHLRVVWEQRGRVLRVVICGALVATLIAFLIPPRYQSSARLMPPDNHSSSGLALAALAGRSGSGGGGSLLGELGSDLLGSRSTSELFAAILISRTVQDRVIAPLDLRKVYGARRIEDARKQLQNRTEISVDRKSQIVLIKVTDKDRYRAAAITQAYVNELNRAVVEVSTSSARRERIFLEGRLKDVKQDLESAEKDFGQYASKNTAIDIKEQGKATVAAAASLQGELIAAQSRLQELRQTYTGNNVRVRGLQARVAELQNQLNKVGGKSEGPSVASGEESESMYPSIRRLPLLGVPWADLYRRVKIQEVLFETLTQQYELARVEEAKEIPTVKVLDAPDVAEKMSWPPRALIIAAGGLLAFLLAIGWVLGIAKWHRTDPRDPGKALATEVLAAVKSTKFLLHGNGSLPRT
jgi:uncharacterized protein involved in exopolysaccharide biosynthesis